MEYTKRRWPSDVQPSCWSPFLPIPSQPAGKFVPKVLGFRVIIEQFCKKKALKDLMDYSHADFQSFPLSHHKVTKARSQYCSVNS